MTSILVWLLAAPSIIYMFSHSLLSHKRTFIRALIVWSMTTSPIFISAAFRDPNSPNAAGSYLAELQSFFSASEAFVYAAAFLAPTFLMVLDVIERVVKNDPELGLRAFKRQAGRMQWVFYSSFVIILLTIVTYVASQLNSGSHRNFYFWSFLEGIGLPLYILSLITWYSTMLWSLGPEPDFNEIEKMQQRDFTSGLKKRIERFGNE